MKQVLIIGSGIAGMSCAISCAEKGINSILVSPFPSERSQSVMAAGGINAVLAAAGSEDSIESHIKDTLDGGCNIAGKDAVSGLCHAAPEIISWLEHIGCVFSRDADGTVSRRAFGGQSHERTCYCGASTGKQIVTAMVMETRKYEAKGLIRRMLWTDFHSALIKGSRCCGALLYNEATGLLDAVYADALVIATGGQNSLFGKTTGSTQCDGYAAGRLFMQGACLKNLEFIQYHPTTIETYGKQMLVSEAARGEGGRLFYEDGGGRVYFMEDEYGSGGNLMPRDVVSRCIYETHRPVYLDVSFLGEERIEERIPEVRRLCMKYRGIDIAKSPIEVKPAVHFFMGGLAVNNSHETDISGLYAIGECASIYHGANRLGGNSLLAALYSGRVAAEAIEGKASSARRDGFNLYIAGENRKMADMMKSRSKFPVMYIRDMLSGSLHDELGIARDEERLSSGLDSVSYYLSLAEKIHYDSSVLAYFNYSLKAILTLAKAALLLAKSRKESRGAHFRTDYPERDEKFGYSSIISYDGGAYRISYDTKGHYES